MKADIAQPVDMYNDWFIRFAPDAYRNTRAQTTSEVEATLKATQNLTDIGVALLRATPGILPTLRMATCSPLAVDRFSGLAGVPSKLVKVMEKDERLPLRMSQQETDSALGRVAAIIRRMADKDILVWLERGDAPSEQERYRAAKIVVVKVVRTRIIRIIEWSGELTRKGTHPLRRRSKPILDLTTNGVTVMFLYSSEESL